jgi:hypothetical protein
MIRGGGGVVYSALLSSTHSRARSKALVAHCLGRLNTGVTARAFYQCGDFEGRRPPDEAFCLRWRQPVSPYVLTPATCGGYLYFEEKGGAREPRCAKMIPLVQEM